MACDEICLAGVNFSSLIKELRRLAFEDGRVGFESHGGLLHLIMKLMAHSGIRQNRMDWLTKDIKVDDHSEWLFYVGCAPYFNACFTHLKVNTLDAVKSSLKLLNLAGIEPALLENERCCGHDLLWSGDVQGFRALAGLNIQEIKKRGFKKMIFFCPECYYSFKKDYQNIFGNLGLEMKSVLEILNEKGIERFAIDSEPDTVTFQDPCRLSRHLDLYDVPRKLMAKIPAITLNEMMHSGRTSRCCAGSNWMNCNAFFRDVQLSRFEEAQETASRYLLTACPKCDIHLRCAGQNWETSKKKPVKLEDIHNFILSKLVNNK
jgi:Fe-S oxidoreductase